MKSNFMIMNNLKQIYLYVVIFIYIVGDVFTFVYLTFFDGYIYSWWNWIIAIPVNIYLASIWPIFWLILRPIFT